jgi:hypothetical protein
METTKQRSRRKRRNKSRKRKKRKRRRRNVGGRPARKELVWQRESQAPRA